MGESARTPLPMPVSTSTLALAPACPWLTGMREAQSAPSWPEPVREPLPPLAEPFDGCPGPGAECEVVQAKPWQRLSDRCPF